MPQFIVLNGTVECPACGVFLKTVREQDKRVAVMNHDKVVTCVLSGEFRVDRLNGYGEKVTVQ